MTNSPPARQPEHMPRQLGHCIAASIFFVPMFLLAVIGLRYGNGNTALGLLMLWPAVILPFSVRIVPQSTFLVVERLGRFWAVKYARFPFHLIIPFVDRVVFRGSFRQQSIDLYTLPDGGRSEIDFLDGSAPILVTGWFQIGDPAALERGDWEALTAAIVRYVYRMERRHVLPFVTETFQSILRSELEPHPIKVAQERLPELVASALMGIRMVVGEIGVYAHTILSSGLALTPTQKAYREQEMRGIAHAKEMIGRSASYYAPLLSMIKECREAGLSFTPQQLLGFFLDQRSLEALEKLRANITLVAPNVRGVVKTLPIAEEPHSGRV